MYRQKIAPRFVREYCAYKRREVLRLQWIPDYYRELIARNLDNILDKCERGYITPDEAVRLLASPLSDLADSVK